MPGYAARPGDRAKGVAGSAVVTGLIGWMIVVGLNVREHLPHVDEQARAFALAPEPPPPPPPARPTRKEAVRHQPAEAAPAGRRATPTDLVAPPPVLPEQPPPMQTSPLPDIGLASNAGAASTGSGQGAGGLGNGRGGGGSGDGDGEGGTPPRQRAGSLRGGDIPRDVDASGTVGVRYAVDVDGRASDCRVTQSSGSASLDDQTCRLIEKRFRFDPARDSSGRPVRSIIVQRHSWFIEHEPPPGGSTPGG